jgi:4'-phosphopantetheinyl transferase
MVETLTIDREEIASWPSDELDLSQFMDQKDLLWPLPPAQVSLGATDVHVWAANLDLPIETLAHFACTLSEQEQQRAARFHFDKHHNRFIAGRGILRALLASYLDRTPDEVQFVYGSNGKPALAGQFALSGLHFNLAHSENLALIAVTRLGAVGVDVEEIRPISDADELVERFFSLRENAQFRQLSPDQKDLAFFNLWTRKEAWLKATGEGIGHSLNRVEVTFLPGEPASLLALPAGVLSRDEWFLRELLPAGGFVGAIALPNLQSSIRNFQFSTLEFP